MEITDPEVETEVFGVDGIFFLNLLDHTEDLKDIANQIAGDAGIDALTNEQAIQLLKGEELELSVD